MSGYLLRRVQIQGRATWQSRPQPRELFYGALKSRRAAQNQSLVDALQFVVLEFDTEDARQAGEIWALLASNGTPFGPYDVLIAGQAVAPNLILVTHDTHGFGRVTGLQIEDWQV
jgi:tRNA(fMet)-specific endonuclease VapC